MTQEAINTYNQGYFYYTGTNGRPKDHKKASQYFVKAAELGVSEAMNYIGLMYESGDVFEKSYKKAVEWFLKAIRTDNGNRFAAKNMARMYYNGFGLPKDMEKAYVYAHAATVLGVSALDISYAQSCYLTGCILLEHYKKYSESVMYFKAAAAHGNIPEAWFNLGWLAARGALPAKCYLGKERVHIDLTANYFYEKAANLGYLPAMDEVGRLNILYQDMRTAKYWLMKAAERGYEPSKKRLKLLKVADTFNRVGSFFGPSGNANVVRVVNNCPSVSEVAPKSIANKAFAFQDSKGNHCTPGAPFYDAKKNICEWGAPFYDFKGNYCIPGGAFYDSKGNYCSWGSPFYDAQGNYIVP